MSADSPLLHVLPIPPTLPLGAEAGRPVVIDLLRATTTIVTALYNGAARIKPVTSVEQGRAECPVDGLLGGEREGVPPPGFHLGNSPLEYSREVVAGKSIWLTTTNGTIAIERCATHIAPLCLAFSNLSATADWLSREAGRVTVVCAGSHGEACAEDFFLAGALAQRLSHGFELTAQAAEAAVKFQDGAADIEAFLRGVKHGKRLLELGFEGDLVYCARVDCCPIVVGMNSDGFLVPKDL